MWHYIYIYGLTCVCIYIYICTYKWVYARGRVCCKSRGWWRTGWKIILSAMRATRASEARTCLGWLVSAGGKWVTYISLGLIFAYRQLASARPPVRPPSTVPSWTPYPDSPPPVGWWEGGVEIIFYFRSVNEQRDIILLLLWVHCRAVYYLCRGRL